MNRLTRTNQTVFGTLSAIFALSIGCFMCGRQLISAEQGGDHYWTHGCVTGDEALLIAGGDEAVSVDLSTGAVAKSVPLYVEAVTCSAKGGIAYAASEDMVRFPSGERGPTDVPSTKDLVGTTPDGVRVHYSRQTDSKARPRGYGKVTAGNAELELASRLFGEVDQAYAGTPSAFFNRVGGVMADGRLLLAAGWSANRSGDSVDPAPWGVFAVDPSARTVSPLIAMQVCSAKLDTSLLWKLAASPDGQRVAVAFRGDGTTRVAVYEGAKVLFTADVEGAREPSALGFSPKGDRLAVATLSDDGARGKVTWFEVSTGAPAWTSPEAEGTIYFLQHLSDGSLVFMRSSRVVTRVAPDGTAKW